MDLSTTRGKWLYAAYIIALLLITPWLFKGMALYMDWIFPLRGR